MTHLSNHATTVAADDTGDMIVTYHNTQIVKFNEHRVVLNMGGFDTITTRKKMNEAAKQFNLPYCVYRVGGETKIHNFVNREHSRLDSCCPAFIQR